jgi:hypothetical protein
MIRAIDARTAELCGQQNVFSSNGDAGTEWRGAVQSVAVRCA